MTETYTGNPVNGGEKNHKLASVPNTSVVRLETGDSLYVCGSPDNNLYTVVSGRLKAVTVSFSGKQCLVDIHCEGDVIGVSCLTSPVRTESIIAMSPATLRKVPRAQLNAFLEQEGLFEKFVVYMADRLARQQNLISRLVTETSEHRLAYVLLMLGRKLGTARPGGKLMIRQRITQDELACMVGTTRSRVGYFLKRFRDERMVERGERSSIIIDESRINEFIRESG